MKIDVITKTMMKETIDNALRKTGDKIIRRLDWLEARIDKIEADLTTQYIIIKDLRKNGNTHKQTNR